MAEPSFGEKVRRFAESFATQQRAAADGARVLADLCAPPYRDEFLAVAAHAERGAEAAEQVLAAMRVVEEYRGGLYAAMVSPAALASVRGAHTPNQPAHDLFALVRSGHGEKAA